MEDKVKVEVEINPKLEEDNITIKVKELSDEVKEIVSYLLLLEYHKQLISMAWMESIYNLDMQ